MMYFQCLMRAGIWQLFLNPHVSATWATFHATRIVLWSIARTQQRNPAATHAKIAIFKVKAKKRYWDFTKVAPISKPIVSQN